MKKLALWTTCLILLGGCGPALPRATSSGFEAYESAEAPGWMQISSGPGRFEVLLPATPHRGANKSWITLRANSLGRRFGVAYRDDKDLNRPGYRTRSLDSLAASYQVDAAEWRPPENMVAFDQPGRKIVFRQKDRRSASVRLLVVGTRMYELYVASAPDEPLPEEDAATFFRSFQPLEKE